MYSQFVMHGQKNIELYIHIYVHTHIHAYIHTYTRIHTYVHTHTYIHTYIITYIHTRPRTHTRAHSRTHTQTDPNGHPKRRGSVAACLLGLWVRIPPGAWMSVCCECCVLSGGGLCGGLITRPEQSYRLWCVWVWSWSVKQWGEPWFARECCALSIYRVSHELRSLLRESIPYIKIYRYNPKHLCPKLNGYGDNGQRKVLTSCISAYCTSSVVNALTLTEQCSRRLCECTSSAQRDKIVLHYCQIFMRYV